MRAAADPEIGLLDDPRTDMRFAAAPLAVMVLTLDEEKNLAACLESVRGLAEAVFVVDSGSTDGTVGVAERFGARVFPHPFEGHARQWNWALRSLPITFDWVLCLDADQRLTPELREEIRRVLLSVPAGVDGFYMKRRQVFLGRWICHGAYYPKYYLKLLRREHARSDEREYLDFRFYVKGRVGYFENDLIEDNRKDYNLRIWIQKHLSFAKKQALEEFHRQQGALRGFAIHPAPLGNPDARTLWLKSIWYRLPLYFRPFFYFLYRYIFRLGFVDGKEGFIFHFLHAFWYRVMVDFELDRLRQEAEKR